MFASNLSDDIKEMSIDSNYKNDLNMKANDSFDNSQIDEMIAKFNEIN